jgi:benzoyl-CoA reductase/2-hydroxyglutaryl-CoA dehydratase subunit BcrC/BadD/HgdB
MKLPSSKECAKMKAYWFEALNRLQEFLEEEG